MIKYIVALLLLISTLNANLLDAYYVKKAQQEYKDKNYEKAVEYFQKVEKPNDKLRYDLANSYYKLKKYQDAQNEYEKISDKELEFKKLHNIGNAYAKTDQLDRAIKSYESALKIKEDKETRENLELIRKKQEEKKKKEQQKKQDKQKQDKKKKKDNKNKQNNNSNQNQNQNGKKKEDKKEQKKKDKKKKKEQNEKGKNKEKNKQKRDTKLDQKNIKKHNLSPKKAQISDMEEKKYLKMLKSRKVNSLMIPMQTKGEKSENIKPW